MIQIDITVNQEALEEWIEYKNATAKKKMSDFAINKVVKMLSSYSEAHQQHIVDVAIQNDWQGLHYVDMPVIEPKKEGDFIAGHTDTSWSDELVKGRLN